MISTRTRSAARKPPSLKRVLAVILASVEGFWQERLLKSKKAMGVAVRLARASKRIELLMKRFKAGEVLWRKRAAKAAVAREPVLAVAAEVAAPAEAKPERPAVMRKSRLPSAHGWLADTLPVTAVYYGPDLITAMQQADMQALMRATPEVAWIMRPIFRMLALEEDVLLVPEGYVTPERVRRETVPRDPAAPAGPGPLELVTRALCPKNGAVAAA